MDRQVGNPHFAFWLLGDSEPDNWKKDLRGPFDSRHPIRHNIWTSILDVLQDEVFRQTRKRFETNDLFIRNAVGNVKHKPSENTVSWHDNTLSEITTFKKLIVQYKPVIICTFGSFSFEFARRAIEEKPPYKYSYWNTERLGSQFRARVSEFDVNKTNLIPLLHRSISGIHFLRSHHVFCNFDEANYFTFVGTEIAKLLIKSTGQLDVWI